MMCFRDALQIRYVVLSACGSRIVIFGVDVVADDIQKLDRGLGEIAGTGLANISGMISQQLLILTDKSINDFVSKRLLRNCRLRVLSSADEIHSSPFKSRVSKVTGGGKPALYYYV
jgi:hypothetical protein